jgi:hypothetical protein
MTIGSEARRDTGATGRPGHKEIGEFRCVSAALIRSFAMADTPRIHTAEGLDLEQAE